MLSFAFFFVCTLAGIAFGYTAACNRKPDVSFIRAALFQSLLEKPELYTEAGLKARGRALTCIFVGFAVWCVAAAWFGYRRWLQ